MKGFQVAPAELEGHILEHPDVADCAVIGIPDAYSGDIPMAFVTLNAEAMKKASGYPSAAEVIKESIKKVKGRKEKLPLRRHEKYLQLTAHEAMKTSEVTRKKNSSNWLCHPS